MLWSFPLQNHLSKNICFHMNSCIHLSSIVYQQIILKDLYWRVHLMLESHWTLTSVSILTFISGFICKEKKFSKKTTYSIQSYFCITNFKLKMSQINLNVCKLALSKNTTTNQPLIITQKHQFTMHNKRLGLIEEAVHK